MAGKKDPCHSLGGMTVRGAPLNLHSKIFALFLPTSFTLAHFARHFVRSAPTAVKQSCNPEGCSTGWAAERLPESSPEPGCVAVPVHPADASIRMDPDRRMWTLRKTQTIRESVSGHSGGWQGAASK